MRRLLVSLLVLSLLVLRSVPLLAAEMPWTEVVEGSVRVHLHLFWSKTCPHCLEVHPRLV